MTWSLHSYESLYNTIIVMIIPSLGALNISSNIAKAKMCFNTAVFV